MITIMFYYSFEDLNKINSLPICYELDELPSFNTSILYVKKMKEELNLPPRGYCLTEDGEIIRRVFFNARIQKNNIQKDLNITEYIISNDEEFCIPYDQNTDSIFSLTI